MNYKDTLILFVMLLTSCNNEVTQQLEPKGTALGVMNEIVVISDDEIWEGAVGDTFRYYFESAFPILPTPEPLFDLRHFTVWELNGQPLRKELRTYIILADLSDEDSETTKMLKADMGSERFNQALTNGNPISSVGKDKWARGQVLIYLFAKNGEALASSVTKNFAATANRIHQHDEKQLKSSIYLDRVNVGLGNEIASKFGIDIQIPGEYQRIINDLENELVWLRKDTKEAVLNIVISKEKYKNQNQLSKAGIIEVVNDFGSEYVSSEIEEDVMVVNAEDLPIYEYSSKIDGQYTKEIRGTWEMTKAFAAGPFIAYGIHNADSNSVVYVTVFVLAPGTEKRDMMMQLDYIIKHANLKSFATGS